MDPFCPVRRAIGGMVILAALIGLLGGCSATPAAPSGAVTVSDAWVRPAAVGSQTAAYVTITNSGPADTLLAVRCTIAASTMLHRTATDASGMTGMSMLDEVPVPAGASVRLEPGGMHVMMTGLTKALEAGGSVELQLTFEHAGVVVVAAAIRPS